MQNIFAFYKKTLSGFITGNVHDTLSFGPPTGGLPVSSYGGIVGTLMPLNTTHVWDLPTANFNGTEHWFSIPAIILNTKMTIYLNWEVEWGYGNTTPSPYNIISKWYVGKNNAPLFHPITTIERNYAIFAPSAFSCWPSRHYYFNRRWCRFYDGRPSLFHRSTKWHCRQLRVQKLKIQELKSDGNFL